MSPNKVAAAALTLKSSAHDQIDRWITFRGHDQQHPEPIRWLRQWNFVLVLQQIGHGLVVEGPCRREEFRRIALLNRQSPSKRPHDDPGYRRGRLRSLRLQVRLEQ